MKRKLIVLILACALIIGVIGMAIPVSAATTAVITVTNTTQYIAVTVSPTSYTLSGISSRGVLPSTTYYTNPGGQTTAPSSTVVDGECAFTMTNSSAIACDFVFAASNFTSGSDMSTNGNTGTAGATSYGCYTYVSGVLLASKVECSSSASGTGISNMAGSGATLKWGFQMNEQTNAWTGGTAGAFTVTATASAH